MTLEEFLAKFPKFADTPLSRKLTEMQRRMREHFAKTEKTHQHMLEAKSDFEFADAEYKAIERAASDRRLTRVTQERDAKGREGTFVDTDHPRLEAARTARDQAKAAYKEARTHYEMLSNSPCGDAAVLRRVIGYLKSNGAVRKAAYEHYGV